MLQNINKLNRSLEGVIAVSMSHCAASRSWLMMDKVGNEFSQVEGLWSQFENVMSKEPEKDGNKDSKEGATEEQSQS